MFSRVFSFVFVLLFAWCFLYDNVVGVVRIYVVYVFNCVLVIELWLLFLVQFRRNGPDYWMAKLCKIDCTTLNLIGILLMKQYNILYVTQ